LGLFEVEVIATIDIDMPIGGWPDPGEITVLNRIALAFELIDHSSHIDRIPEDDGIGDKIEATGLMLSTTSISDEDMLAQVRLYSPQLAGQA
jgi:hypothetical protein